MTQTIAEKLVAQLMSATGELVVRKVVKPLNRRVGRAWDTYQAKRKEALRINNPEKYARLYPEPVVAKPEPEPTRDIERGYSTFVDDYDGGGVFEVGAASVDIEEVVEPVSWLERANPAVIQSKIELLSEVLKRIKQSALTKTSGRIDTEDEDVEEILRRTVKLMQQDAKDSFRYLVKKYRLRDVLKISETDDINDPEALSFSAISKSRWSDLMSEATITYEFEDPRVNALMRNSFLDPKYLKEEILNYYLPR